MKDEVEEVVDNLPICPYCGASYQDSEIDDGDCEVLTCGSCERDFEAELNISYTYTTRAPETLESKVKRAREDGFDVTVENKVGDEVKRDNGEVHIVVSMTPYLYLREKETYNGHEW